MSLVDVSLKHAPQHDTRRYGRFTVPTAWARHYSSDYLRVLGKCAVVRAEMLFINDVIEIYAYSDHFEALAQGEIVPVYVWKFTDDGHLWCERVGV